MLDSAFQPICFWNSYAFLCALFVVCASKLNSMFYSVVTHCYRHLQQKHGCDWFVWPNDQLLPNVEPHKNLTKCIVMYVFGLSATYSWAESSSPERLRLKYFNFMLLKNDCRHRVVKISWLTRQSVMIVMSSSEREESSQDKVYVKPIPIMT